MSTLLDRFDEKYQKGSSDECWQWLASTNEQGYGQIKADYGLGNKKYYAHRVAFEKAKGPVPEGLVVDHICKNPGCVNSAHLRAVTKLENTMIGNGFYAVNGRKTHCDRGHLFSPENTVIRSDGGKRRCRICKNFQEKRRRRQVRGTWVE